MPTRILLSVRNLRKLYVDEPVFQGVDLEVAAGERVAILGDSGVGKSTLLNLLAGLDQADGGSVQLAGVDVSTLAPDAAAVWRRRHVGFVFQAFHVLPHLTVAQNVALPLMLLNLGAPEQRLRVAELLAAVGLQGFGDRAPRTLSGGQLQRVAIARALVHRPALVLADEPTGNLDPATAAQVLTVLETRSREHGAALVLVTHSEAAAQRADRALRLTREGIVPLSLA